jgi:hypothetical protein
MNQAVKLRLRNNSVRRHLTRPEVERLRNTALVAEWVNFGGCEMWAYRVQSRWEQGPVDTAFGQSVARVTLSKESAQTGLAQEKGLYARIRRPHAEKFVGFYPRQAYT